MSRSAAAKFYDLVCFAIKVRDVCSILLGRDQGCKNYSGDGFCANFMSTFGDGGQSIVLFLGNVYMHQSVLLRRGEKLLFSLCKISFYQRP